MRALVVVLVLLWASPGPAADEKEAKPLTPAEAAKHVNEKCTVELEVKSSAKARNGMVFLNSESNYRDGKNFTVVIEKKDLEKFKKAEIADPAAHYKGKTVHVTGTVSLYQNRPQLKVEDPAQIKVVETKK